jgi:hypothetical protein
LDPGGRRVFSAFEQLCRKETEKETVWLKRSDEKREESLLEERKVRETADRKLQEKNKGIEDAV